MTPPCPRLLPAGLVALALVRRQQGHDPQAHADRRKQGRLRTLAEATQGAPMPPQPRAADQEAKLEQVAAWIAGMAE